jgi:hypothetical protein
MNRIYRLSGEKTRRCPSHCITFIVHIKFSVWKTLINKGAYFSVSKYISAKNGVPGLEVTPPPLLVGYIEVLLYYKF